MGISKFLKHLYFGEHLLGFIHLESLQLRSILSASSLMTKLLGLLLSAIQSISILLEVVRIYISSDSLGEYLAGFSFLNEFGMMKLTVFHLSKISCMKKVFSRSTVSSFASVWESWFVVVVGFVFVFLLYFLLFGFVGSLVVGLFVGFATWITCEPHFLL